MSSEKELQKWLIAMIVIIAGAFAYDFIIQYF